ncbi:uncharacterized protein BDV14DRAFT_55749 [Aspergillus stella-maris]|uniref:uncharacterized protein n=1 Tax=Aspergillus stella-maris TaxID=1810926 RepID=UPI003CCCF9A1
MNETNSTTQGRSSFKATNLLYPNLLCSPLPQSTRLKPITSSVSMVPAPQCWTVFVNGGRKTALARGDSHPLDPVFTIYLLSSLVGTEI